MKVMEKISDTKTPQGLRVIVFENDVKTLVRLTRPYLRAGEWIDAHISDTTINRTTGVVRV